MKFKMKLGIAEIITLVFVILKLSNVITWNWWWVFSPIIIAVCIIIIVNLIVSSIE